MPAYSQLVSLLRARIAAGEWSTGPLASVRALQQEYGVGRDTVLRWQGYPCGGVTWSDAITATIGDRA